MLATQHPFDKPGIKISRRGLLLFTWDAGSWFLAVGLASIVRFESLGFPEGIVSNATLAAFCILMQFVIGNLLFLLYRGRFLLGSISEVFGLAGVVFLVAIGALVFRLTVQGAELSRSIPLLAGVFALIFMLGGRLAARSIRTRRGRTEHGERSLIYGAGDSGEQIVRQMLLNEPGRYTPLGFLDDDGSKRHLRLHGLPVHGTIAALEVTAQRLGVETLVVAIAGADSRKLLNLDRRCQALNVNLRVIPSTSEILGGAVTLGDITHVSEEDLLGRRPVRTDETGIRKMLSGKRILITGAGGSIGSEISRQVHRYEPAFVGMLDRDESGLHATQLSIDGQGLLDGETLILADIRDRDRVHEAFGELKPDIVFHAAALKHLPLLQRHPQEAHKTNVLGTQNVLDAAKNVGVGVFVNISTDKAADSTSVLGASKRQTEELTAQMGTGDARYVSVRFGNVLGSRGSVLNAFRHQIANGGPVTVTHPDVTRYFMTVSEAVHLVLQAALIGENGEVLILDMGKPVRIDDVAKQMIKKSGRNIEVVYTGLRDGEKLEEVLTSADEFPDRRVHPLITHVKVQRDETSLRKTLGQSQP